MINKLFTRKGLRVVAHSLLAAAGIGLLYLLSRMVIGDIQHEDGLGWWLIGVAMTLPLWLVALGNMLVKVELTNWR